MIELTKWIETDNQKPTRVCIKRESIIFVEEIEAPPKIPHCKITFEVGNLVYSTEVRESYREFWNKWSPDYGP